MFGSFERWLFRREAQKRLRYLMYVHEFETDFQMTEYALKQSSAQKYRDGTVEMQEKLAKMEPEAKDPATTRERRDQLKGQIKDLTDELGTRGPIQDRMDMDIEQTRQRILQLRKSAAAQELQLFHWKTYHK